MTHIQLPEGTHQVVDVVPVANMEHLLAWHLSTQTTFNLMQDAKRPLLEIPELSRTDEQADYLAELQTITGSLLDAMEQIRETIEWFGMWYGPQEEEHTS